MKKVFVIMLIAGFLAGMSACGGGTPAPTTPEPQVEEVVPCDEQEMTADEDAAEEETPEEEQVEE